MCPLCVSRKQESDADVATRNLLTWGLYMFIGFATGTLAFFIAIAVEHLLEWRCCLCRAHHSATRT